MSASELPAGEFGAWLREIRQAIRDGADATVPCQGCTACCRASQFIEISPDEAGTLAHVPAALLFPAPGRPGYRVLGYDEHGRCPMLVDDRCSIYDHRPRACRTYDCRVFAATGIYPDEPGQAGIGERARRWRFSYADPAARLAQESLEEAAAERGGGSATEIAVRVVAGDVAQDVAQDVAPEGE